MCTIHVQDSPRVQMDPDPPSSHAQERRELGQSYPIVENDLRLLYRQTCWHNRNPHLWVVRRRATGLSYYTPILNISTKSTHPESWRLKSNACHGGRVLLNEIKVKLT